VLLPEQREQNNQPSVRIAQLRRENARLVSIPRIAAPDRTDFYLVKTQHETKFYFESLDLKSNIYKGQGFALRRRPKHGAAIPCPVRGRRGGSLRPPLKQRFSFVA
jgi:hypothetical protein